MTTDAYPMIPPSIHNFRYGMSMRNSPVRRNFFPDFNDSSRIGGAQYHKLQSTNEKTAVLMSGEFFQTSNE